MQLLTRRQVAERLAVAPRTLDKIRSSRADFPQPLRLGPQTLRWQADHIDLWIQSQTAPKPAARRSGGRRTAAELLR